VLSVVGASIMIGAGGLTAYLSFGVNPRTFFDLGAVAPRHLVLGLCKAACYGAAIPIVAGFCGLRARGSSEGVGWATTAAVVGGSFAVIAIDFALSVGALWLLGGNL
jgi:phospholipid/cholesterol/gamma-HCH transport system permease protein